MKTNKLDEILNEVMQYGMNFVEGKNKPDFTTMRRAKQAIIDLIEEEILNDGDIGGEFWKLVRLSDMFTGEHEKDLEEIVIGMEKYLRQRLQKLKE